MRIVLEPLRTDRRKVEEVIDANGRVRKCLPILMSWIADLEGQWLICALLQSSCPRCQAIKDVFGLDVHCGIRSGDDIRVCVGFSESSDKKVAIMVCMSYCGGQESRDWQRFIP